MGRCASLSLLLGWYYAVKIPCVATTANTTVLHVIKEMSDGDCFFGTVSVSSEYLRVRERPKPTRSALADLVPSSGRAQVLPGFPL